MILDSLRIFARFVYASAFVSGFLITPTDNSAFATHCRFPVQDSVAGLTEYDRMLQYAAEHPIRTFTIQVVNQAQEPVAGAGLKVFVREESSTHRADEKGRCELQMPEMDTFRAVVVASDESGKHLGLTDLRRSLQTKKTDELRLSLYPASRAEVFVVDENEQPVADATVGVKFQAGGYATASTDQQGRAEVLFPRAADSRQVFAWSREHGMDYCRISQENISGGKNGEATPAEPVRLRLDGFQDPITVTVKDETGLPVEGVTVMPSQFQKLGQAGSFSWYGIDGGGMFENKTNEEGVVTFREIPVWVEGHLIFSANKSGFSDDRIEFSELRGTRQLAATVIAKRLIKGHVTDENGQPAANLPLSINGRFFKRSNRLDRATEVVSTDNNGDFQFWAAPYGAWLPRVVDPNRVLDGPAIFTVTKDDPVAIVQLKLRKPTLLKGLITTGEDKTPVANAVVRFEVSESAIITAFAGREMPISCSHELVARSNDAGEFQVHSGYGQVKVRGPTHFPEVEFDIVDETEKTFVLHHSLPARGVLQGKVVSGLDFQPVAGAIVSFRYLDERIYEKGEMPTQYVTDTEGKFETDRKWAKVLVHVCTEDRSLAAFVEVGSEPELAKVKLMPTQTVTGRLLDGAGNPMPDSYVYATRLVGNRNLGGKGEVTDAEGRFSINGMLPGFEYILQYSNMHKGGNAIAWISKFTLEPGTESFDLGDVTYERVPPGNGK